MGRHRHPSVAQVITLEYGTTLVRCARPEVEWIDITAMGDRFPVLLEKWRGWRVDLWGDWTWIG